MEILTEKEQQQLVDAIGKIDEFQGRVQEGEMCNLDEEKYQKVKICDFALGFDKLTKNHITFALDWFTPVSKLLTKQFKKILHKDIKVHILSIDTANHEMLYKYVSLPAYTGKVHYGDALTSWIIPDRNLTSWLLQWPIEDRNDRDLSKKEEKQLYKQCFSPVIKSVNKGLETLADDYGKYLSNAYLKYDGFKKVENVLYTYIKPESYCVVTLGIEPENSEEASKVENVAELTIAINARAVRVLGDSFMGVYKKRGMGVTKEMLENVKLPVQVVLGTCNLTTAEMLKLECEQIVQLDKIAGADVDLVFGNEVIAHGEVVIDSQEHYGIRITDFPNKKES